MGTDCSNVDFLGIKGVVLGGLICSNVDHLAISEDTSLTVESKGHVHNNYKLDITTSMGILFFSVALG